MPLCSAGRTARTSDGSMTTPSFSDVRSLTTLLRMAIGRGLMDIHTALPGVVDIYDSAARRARVVPAIHLLLDDGSTAERPPIPDVPVLFPSGGGLSLTFPLGRGDPVLLVFSQRGMAGFKSTFSMTSPSRGPIMDMSDAVALAGFGSRATTPASMTGASLQTDDGVTSVVVEPTGEVNISTTGPVTIRASQINLLTA